MTALTVTPTPAVDITVDSTAGPFAHIVKTMPGEKAAAKVTEARILGIPIEALCGHVWVPSRDPKQLPLCDKCREVYNLYIAANDGLNETPGE